MLAADFCQVKSLISWCYRVRLSIVLPLQGPIFTLYHVWTLYRSDQGQGN
jgi:hypothetical protein